jgi:hypothetical protein
MYLYIYVYVYIYTYIYITDTKVSNGKVVMMNIVQRSPVRYEIILESRITENSHVSSFYKSSHCIRKV